eukprot:394066_1
MACIASNGLDKMYVVGGLNETGDLQQIIQIYDIYGDDWTTKNIQFKVMMGECVYHNHSVYVFPTLVNQYVRKLSLTGVNDLDIPTLTDTIIGNIDDFNTTYPAQKTHSFAIYSPVDYKIYYGGGLVGGSPDTIYNDIYTVNVLNDEFQPDSHLTVAIASPAAVFIVNQTIKIMGGLTLQGEVHQVKDITQYANIPTLSPTSFPTAFPTLYPTQTPTRSPTKSPTSFPTAFPTMYPTFVPTQSPQSPTQTPTRSPTKSPTSFPTAFPTMYPTFVPTQSPTQTPTRSPTKSPTSFPTGFPTMYPTFVPTQSPTIFPTPITGHPSFPTRTPTVTPTRITGLPTLFPTSSPTFATSFPSNYPTSSPTYSPSFSAVFISTLSDDVNAEWITKVDGLNCGDGYTDLREESSYFNLYCKRCGDNEAGNNGKCFKCGTLEEPNHSRTECEFYHPWWLYMLETIAGLTCIGGTIAIVYRGASSKISNNNNEELSTSATTNNTT